MVDVTLGSTQVGNSPREGGRGKGGKEEGGLFNIIISAHSQAVFKLPSSNGAMPDIHSLVSPTNRSNQHPIDITLVSHHPKKLPTVGDAKHRVSGILHPMLRNAPSKSQKKENKNSQRVNHLNH